jgi:aminoglycoside phosphotransferase (APT) family kinase protein
MNEAPFDVSRLQAVLPDDVVGRVVSIAPIRVGLSGAGVYAVDTDRGAYVLRIDSGSASDAAWIRHLTVLRAAADAGIAPAVVHVDERERAIVLVRVDGQLTAALGDPTQRDRAIVSVIEQLKAVHALDLSGFDEMDGVAYARAAFEKQRDRAGYPSWARELGLALDAIADLLREDRRRVVSHNDMNPGNVLWDGAKAWLIDWEVAAISHPYYDVATFATFLNLDLGQASGLLALQEQRPLDDADRAMLAALRRLAAVAVGCTLLGLVQDLAGVPESRDAAPTLADIYARMRNGTFDLQSANGQTAFALAFLRIATGES